MNGVSLRRVAAKLWLRPGASLLCLSTRFAPAAGVDLEKERGEE